MYIKYHTCKVYPCVELLTSLCLDQYSAICILDHDCRDNGVGQTGFENVFRLDETPILIV